MKSKSKENGLYSDSEEERDDIKQMIHNLKDNYGDKIDELNPE